MAYFYKRFDIPEFKESRWDLLLAPILEWTIDNLVLSDYKVQMLDELNNIVYAGKLNPDGKWLIKRVEEVSESNYETTWATVVNNPSYTTLVDAYNNRLTLVYGPDSINLIQ